MADSSPRFPPFPPLRGIIFDMDGTLYRSARLNRAYSESVYRLVAQRRRLTLDQARALFDRAHAALSRRLGRRPSKFYTLSRLGISDRAWAAGPGREVAPAAVLRPNPRLRRTLETLAGCFRLGLVTNNHRGNAEATLRRLGVREVFDEILTLSESRRFKPAPQLYREMARRLNLKPSECVSVGDSFEMDLEPAARIGMHTLLVRQVGDLYRLPRSLRPAAAPALSLRTAAGRRLAWVQAGAALRRGRLVVVPTDTVYGLAAAPDPAAVRWLYRAKGRHEDKPLVLLVSDTAAARRVVRWPAAAQVLAARHWPGPLTLVLPIRPGSNWGRLTRGGRTVAVRMPDHAWLRQLIRRQGGVLPVTSANASGEAAPTVVGRLSLRIRVFAELIADDGHLAAGVPSTIARRAGRTWRVLRQGGAKL